MCFSTGSTALLTAPGSANDCTGVQVITTLKGEFNGVALANVKLMWCWEICCNWYAKPSSPHVKSSFKYVSHPGWAEITPPCGWAAPASPWEPCATLPDTGLLYPSVMPGETGLVGFCWICHIFLLKDPLPQWVFTSPQLLHNSLFPKLARELGLWVNSFQPLSTPLLNVK